ncbi:alpha/beta fold hydrolase [Microbacterium sp. W1N]|uniref:alpha/beta fold hydrolase n=1 Tax=Microbacterium festucae TaxID=2977531 RepID=UPI0021BE1DF7|nr:alpha/beta fold hydrolase [Microbacterium festucae]MCT9821222.1 alpha/beta fold hydrolase [Microbacterium festucae]
MLAVAGCLVLAAEVRLVGDAVERIGLTAFYAQPADAADGEPGSIVRRTELEGTPADARAWRLMYRTTDLNGAAVVATGILVVPLDPHPGPRTVVAWGHPTTGTDPDCAPSRSFDPFELIEGLRFLLDRGYTVVATDYVGMGTDGPDSYLVGATAAHSMLDAVRAAQHVDAAEAGDEVILWGHSQGGQAALFAAETAGAYAPELTVTAVAVAAPAADLTALMADHLDDISGATIGSYAFRAFSEVYADRGADLATILTPDAVAIQPEMNRLCLLTDLTELHALAQPVVGRFTAADPTTTEPWKTLLAENSAGATPFGAPLFIAQGLSDELVLPAATRAFAAHEAEQGMDVTLHEIDGAVHGTIAYLTLPALMSWFDDIGV